MKSKANMKVQDKPKGVPGRKFKVPTLTASELKTLEKRLVADYAKVLQVREVVMPDLMGTMVKLYLGNVSQTRIAEICGCGQQWVSLIIRKAKKQGLLDPVEVAPAKRVRATAVEPKTARKVA